MTIKTQVHTCRKCQSEDLVKNGTNASDSPLYHCKTCGTYGVLEPKLRVSPCSGCETGHPSPPFALRSGDNLYVPRTPRSGATASALRASARPLRRMAWRRIGCACIWPASAPGPTAPSPLRPAARAYAYRGLPASRFPGGQRTLLGKKRKKSLDLFPLITLWYL